MDYKILVYFNTNTNTNSDL